MSSIKTSKLDRFQKIIRKIGYENIAQFSKDTGIPHQTVRSQVLRERFNENVLSAISDKGGSVDWLLTGKGNTLLQEKEEPVGNNPIRKKRDLETEILFIKGQLLLLTENQKLLYEKFETVHLEMEAPKQSREKLEKAIEAANILTHKKSSGK